MDSFTLISTLTFLCLGIFLVLFKLTHLSNELRTKMHIIGFSLIFLSGLHLVFVLIDELFHSSDLLWRLDFVLFFTFSNLLNYEIFGYLFLKYHSLKVKGRFPYLLFLSSFPAVLFLITDKVSFWNATLWLNALAPSIVFTYALVKIERLDICLTSILLLALGYFLSVTIFYSTTIFWVALGFYYAGIVGFVLSQVFRKDYYYMIPTPMSQE